MNDFITIATQYGPLGIVVLACFWYIVMKDKEHREERKEITSALERQHTEAIEVTKANTTVLTEISVLIRNRKS
jgi:hypothetical protein